MITYKKLFFRYLKIKGIYYTFFNYTDNYVKSLINNENKYFNPIRIFLVAFFWSQTKEGNEFWKNISNEWINMLPKYTPIDINQEATQEAINNVKQLYMKKL